MISSFRDLAAIALLSQDDHPLSSPLLIDNDTFHPRHLDF